jgi:hypothetical protein
MNDTPKNALHAIFGIVQFVRHANRQESMNNASVQVIANQKTHSEIIRSGFFFLISFATIDT